MSLAQGNNTPTRPRIEPGSPDPESNVLTTRPVRPPISCFKKFAKYISRWRSGAVVRASDFGPRGPWFEPRPVHISLWP